MILKLLVHNYYQLMFTDMVPLSSLASIMSGQAASPGVNCSHLFLHGLPHRVLHEGKQLSLNYIHLQTYAHIVLYCIIWLEQNIFEWIL